MAAQELSPASKRSVTVMSVVGLRQCMPSLFRKEANGGVYILNAFSLLPTIIEAKQMLSGQNPVAATAQSLRSAL